MSCSPVPLLHYGWRVRGDLRPEISSFFCDGTRDTRALHLALVVDDDTSVVLKVDHGAILAAPALALPDNDGEKHFLAEIRLALLDGAQNHVSDTARRKAVEASMVALHCDAVQVPGTSVVRAVHDRSNGKRQGDAELAPVDVGVELAHIY